MKELLIRTKEEILIKKVVLLKDENEKLKNKISAYKRLLEWCLPHVEHYMPDCFELKCIIKEAEDLNNEKI